MKALTLKRVSVTEHGVFGVILINNIPLVLTLELPWRDNQRNISCIPAGSYTCRQRISNR